MNHPTHLNMTSVGKSKNVKQRGWRQNQALGRGRRWVILSYACSMHSFTTSIRCNGCCSWIHTRTCMSTWIPPSNYIQSWLHISLSVLDWAVPFTRDKTTSKHGLSSKNERQDRRSKLLPWNLLTMLLITTAIFLVTLVTLGIILVQYPLSLCYEVHTTSDHIWALSSAPH